MPAKKTINLAVPQPLLEEFNEVCAHYGHAKQKGLVLSAAMLMFLEADPAEQGKALERIMIADVRSGVESLIERARTEQARRIESRQQSDGSPAEAPAAVDPARPRAAKKAGEARTGYAAEADEPDPGD